MEKFKDSNLFKELHDKPWFYGLSDETWNFIDANADDWKVKETRLPSGRIKYTLTIPYVAYFQMSTLRLKETISGFAEAIAVYLDVAAETWTLRLQKKGLGFDSNRE